MILYGEQFSGFVKLTSGQLARLLVSQAGQNAAYWGENSLANIERMTEREIQQVESAVDKQIERLNSFLGFEKLYTKVYEASKDIPGTGEI